MLAHTSSPLVWLITGGSSGLGLSLVKRVLARGDFVIAPVRDPAKLFAHFPADSTGSSPVSDRLHTFKFDLADSFETMKKNVDESAKIWGRIDVLVNNAARVAVGILEEGGSNIMKETFDVNFFGVVNLTTAVLPHMRARRSGTVIMTGSRSAFRNEFYSVGFYAASKAALHSYGESLAAEVKPFNIRVLVLIPGSFLTPSLTNLDLSFVINHPESWITDYDAARHAILNFRNSTAIPSFTGGGDPDRGMDVLVDVVKGEGRMDGFLDAGVKINGAGMVQDRGVVENVEKGHLEEWPTWLFLGEDCMQNIRARMEKINRTVAAWEKIGLDVGFQGEKAT